MLNENVPPAVPPDGGEPSFEAALRRLEQIVRSLESGEATLGESMQLFEEGVSLARRCSQLLNLAERKIDLLVEQDDGTYSLRPLDAESAGDVKGKA
jgi:exodeoxyribonuclease VII small subunit